MIQIRTFPFPQLWCHPTPKALFKYEWHPVYVRINNMYTHKCLQKCKYCSAHKSLPPRLPRKTASGLELVAVSIAEANNEVKYIYACVRHVKPWLWITCLLVSGDNNSSVPLPLRPWLHMWWEMPPSASNTSDGLVSVLHDRGWQSRWARNGFVTQAQVYANTVIMLKFA